MWFLEHESLFGGKRVWLRPGSQQLFGRTRAADQDGPQGRNWKIDNKAVSRKHVMLKVYEVAPEDGTKLHKRPQIEVTDLSCRQGTTIDEKTTLKSQKTEDGTVTYSSEILKGTEHTIRLAQGYAPFKIVWRPVVFTYASKESRDGKARSTQLHSLDIKTTTDFVFDKTTHVVSAKRNLPKVLSGLTSGKHIVTAEFLEAILRVAAASVDEEQNYIPSQLEEDFDAWWPPEKDYIPAAGAEPVARPQEMLLPDASRSEVFSGLTFVFLNEGQYSSLLDPVTGGGGKALLYNVRPGETTVEEYVDYVHSVAGKKRRGKSSEKLPVITVRLPTYPDAMEEWAASFVTGADQALGQRSILQNEFLDVIITKDRTQLQRPPAEVIQVPSSDPVPDSAPTRRSTRARTPMSRSGTPSQSREGSAAPAEEPTKVVPRKRISRSKTSRFIGFDDDEPIPKKKLKVETIPEENVQQVAASGSSVATSQTQAGPSTQNQASLPLHIQDSVEKEEQMDTLFPTAAKMRKQRAATRALSVSVEPEAGEPIQKSSTKGVDALARLNKAKAKAEKEINVREHTRQRIKEEEERRKADEENLQEALQGIDISELKNLAQIEEMDILPRQNRSSTHNQSRAGSDRWNPEWNGRKNFKRFRRRGTEQGVQGHKVIVTLEEAPPKKGFGIGDAFFLEDVEPSSRSHHSRRGTQADDDEASEPEVGGFARRKHSTQTQTPREVINVEDSGPYDEEVVPTERTQRSSGRTQRVVETQLEGTQTQGSRKRGSGAASGPPAKKGRFGRRDDDSDEEETGFRFKRRG